MESFFIFGATVCGAYLLQSYLGLQQIKHFNQVYSRLRRSGKVAIGRRAGRLRAGTIVMFAVKNDGEIIEAQYLQGTTILAKFKQLQGFEGEYIQLLHSDTPSVAKENSLVKKTIQDAVEVYQKVQRGEQINEQAPPFGGLSLQVKMIWSSLQHKFRRSV